MEKFSRFHETVKLCLLTRKSIRCGISRVGDDIVSNSICEWNWKWNWGNAIKVSQLPMIEGWTLLECRSDFGSCQDKLSGFRSWFPWLQASLQHPKQSEVLKTALRIPKSSVHPLAFNYIPWTLRNRILFDTDFFWLTFRLSEASIKFLKIHFIVSAFNWYWMLINQ
jgi:hypothetical protein